MFQRHADKGAERWEIYAWAVRDVLAKFGNLKTSDQPNNDKIKYKYFMQGKTDKITYNGKTWVGTKTRKNCAVSKIDLLTE